MRVLFLIRRIDTNNGITSYCDTLSSGLSAVGVKVDLMYSELHRYANDEGRWASLCRSLSSVRAIGSLREVPNLVTWVILLRHLRSRKIDVVNLHGLGMLLWGKIISLVTHIPVVATYHPSVHGNITDISDRSKQPMSRKQKLALRWCAPDRLIVLSNESAEYLVGQCPKIRDRIVLVSGAVDDEYFRPPKDDERTRARRALQLKENDLVILQVGRMSWNKGADLLIDAIRQVRTDKTMPTIRCLFVGSGDEGAQIKERAYQRPEDNESFTFLGFVDDLRSVLWAGDIFVLPSRLEGFALAVVEAMSAGLVAIRTPSGGADEQVISGETGYIVPFDSPDAIAAAIQALSHPVEYAQFRSRSLLRAQERFTKAAMARTVMGVYSGLGPQRNG